MTTERYRLIGSHGSPYSRKLRALMRYRRLSFDWVLKTTRNRDDYADVKPALVPILEFPDGSRMIDTTPIIAVLEERHQTRSVYPADPALRFICLLLEDFADEWLTKAMFHYRWAYADDIEYASLWIADDSFPDADEDERLDIAQQFAERQIGRMELVGCTSQNAPVIEQSYLRVLELLEEHVNLHCYLFGGRPSAADFALGGQLMVLATDPTPLRLMRDRAQRTESWLRQMDDLSGIEGDWDDDLPETTQAMLDFAGRVYLPFLDANARHRAAGRRIVELDLLGKTYRQPTFPYQVKCLSALRRQFAELDDADTERVRDWLAPSGANKYLYREQGSDA